MSSHNKHKNFDCFLGSFLELFLLKKLLKTQCNVICGSKMWKRLMTLVAVENFQFTRKSKTSKTIPGLIEFYSRHLKGINILGEKTERFIILLACVSC